MPKLENGEWDDEVDGLAEDNDRVSRSDPREIPLCPELQLEIVKPTRTRLEELREIIVKIPSS